MNAGTWAEWQQKNRAVNVGGDLLAGGAAGGDEGDEEELHGAGSHNEEGAGCGLQCIGCRRQLDRRSESSLQCVDYGTIGKKKNSPESLVGLGALFHGSDVPHS